jgi:hypothetical protein
MALITSESTKVSVKSIHWFQSSCGWRMATLSYNRQSADSCLIWETPNMIWI